MRRTSWIHYFYFTASFGVSLNNCKQASMYFALTNYWRYVLFSRLDFTTSWFLLWKKQASCKPSKDSTQSFEGLKDYEYSPSTLRRIAFIILRRFEGSQISSFNLSKDCIYSFECLKGHVQPFKPSKDCKYGTSTLEGL